MLGLVSDNDNKMVLMCKMVHQAYGCNAHYLNLVKPFKCESSRYLPKTIDIWMQLIRNENDY